MMIFYDYVFKTTKFQQKWNNIISYTFENMELYYRKQLSMQRLLSYFRRAFHITPTTIKRSNDEKLFSKKLLAIYLLTKYSNESFEDIAKEFYISLETLEFIAKNRALSSLYIDDIRLFFKQFEEDYIYEMKALLAFEEKLSLDL